MPGECEGIMAFPHDWTVPEHIDWDEETYDSLRYHALGNAVTPPVAEWLAGRIASHLDAEVAFAPGCESLSDLQVAEASTS